MATRIEPLPGQESVWDYPRPPKVEPFTKKIEIVFGGKKIVETTSALRVLETSHPPVYYIPLSDIDPKCLERNNRKTFCEFKGQAVYYTLAVDDKKTASAGWLYPNPSVGYESLINHIAFYPSKMDSCTIDGELVQAQEGDFYGGWITNEIVGPFKGAADTWHW